MTAVLRIVHSLPTVGSRVRVRHRGRMKRGTYVVEGYDRTNSADLLVMLRLESRAAGRYYRIGDVEFEEATRG